MLLISADLVFIALHLIYLLTSLLHLSYYDLSIDKSFSEVYQYIKWFWIVILFAYIARAKSSFTYLSWAVLFAYLLMDDALRFHEHAGYFFEDNLSFTPPLGLRLQDMGELTITAISSIFLFSVIAWSYQHGTQAFKKMSLNILLLTFALAFFGIFIDMVHSMVRSHGALEATFLVIEDGGEMLVASLIVWYVFLSLSNESDAPDFYSLLRLAFSRSKYTASISET